MQVTLQSVFDSVRADLGDYAITGGEVFTNEVLQSHFNSAWNELYQALALVGSPRVIRTFYWILPANTGTLSPQGIGLMDFAEPETVYERGNFQFHHIVSTNTATPIQVTDTAHGFGTPKEIYLDGVAGTRAPWGRWFITVVDASNYTLNGSDSDGNAGTGGTVAVGTDQFAPMAYADQNQIDSLQPAQSLVYYNWQDEAFQFAGSTEARQLRITYLASGVPPTSYSQMLGLDDCQAYLQKRTAGFAAHAKGWYQMATDLKAEALGSRGMADGSGGLLYTWLASQVRAMQRTQTRRRSFRERGNQPIYLGT